MSIVTRASFEFEFPYAVDRMDDSRYFRVYEVARPDTAEGNVEVFLGHSGAARACGNLNLAAKAAAEAAAA